MIALLILLVCMYVKNENAVKEKIYINIYIYIERERESYVNTILKQF